MPIYEYRCPDCGFQKEHLQKMSDEPLSTCPSCGATGYAKLLSAAGFQLKGSGWYATDFKGGGASSASSSPSSSAPAAHSCSGGGCGCH
ncbi:FmdB family zinc ribbon protein [Thauera sp.]|uniref:FmdB family zinc ribbon protein n=1 Tax=Thauera sp. TaxID=1905334 RepID=UPI0039E6447B